MGGSNSVTLKFYWVRRDAPRCLNKKPLPLFSAFEDAIRDWTVDL